MAGEIAFAAGVAFASLIVGSLTLIAEHSANPLVMDGLFFPLASGLIAGILITGFHGGTATQEAAAPYIAAVVNIICYLLFLLLIRVLWRYLMAQRNSPTKGTS